MDRTEAINEAIDRLGSYRLFTTLLLSLPDEDLVNRVLGLGREQLVGDSKGAARLAAYVEECAGKSVADVLQDIAVDRAHVLRNASQEGARPPYEPSYTKNDVRASIAGLNVFYADAGYLVSHEVHETSDYIGVEMSFMQTAVERELQALQLGDDGAASAARDLQRRFWEQHLGVWAADFARETAENARTGFWQAIALILLEHSERENDLLAA